MGKLFRNLWRILAAPFIILYNIVLFPFRLIKRAWVFLAADSHESAGKSLAEHIDDLRAHLLRIVLGLALTVGASFYVTVPFMKYLAQPVGGLTNLQAIEVTEEIGVFMRVALTSGITVALPYIAFELWWFAAKGLTAREKRFSLLAIPSASILFVFGLGLTYYLLIPAALPFLGSFTEITQAWTAKDYFGFITGLMMWIGLFCEFPLVVFVLTYLNLITPKALAQQWRLAIVIIAILAAAVTPTIDAATMSLVMLPMILLYFVSVGLSYLAAALRGKEKPNEEKPSKKGKPAAR